MWIGLAVVAAAGIAGLLVFEPWQLFVDDVVDEEIPAAAPAPAQSEELAGSTSTVPEATPTTTRPPPTPVLVRQGTFISHEHATTGTAEVIRLEDGRHVLGLRGLNTSNGPDLHVWLTNAPVIEGRDGWHVFDDGLYVSVGPLKGNIGDQVYDIPGDVDLAQFTSVTIWCDRFNVSFGAATLGPPA
jgi:hypothetical protein